ncbi:SDR family oxidoreductase [Hyalangium versicolor]|uniref:SDR family oxidoreductase n=1 Tax=Hyalangium versicolor TaxID=2861190 RepID=UPI001CCF7BC7|nr:SDR family oxidoreductase [Hyalangium versicolor]
MRVFVTGGSGFVGAELVPELIRAGHRVLGLARSEASARTLRAAGAEVHEGNLADLDGLRRGAVAADAVIHAAFDLDLADWAKGGEADRRAIEALGAAIAGSERLLVVTSGAFAIGAPGVASEEDGARAGGHPRVTEQAAAEASARGARVALLRLGVVHGDGDRHFLPALIALARAKGISAYVGDGAQRWPQVHVRDAAEAYRLTLERGAAGARYHAIAEEGVAVREIAAVIARKLGIPLVAQSPEEAAAHFGVLAPFVSADRPTTSARTREELGWSPHHPGVLEDLKAGNYFTLPA